MNNTYRCAHCATENHLSRWVLEKSKSAPAPQRCSYCGAVHSVTRDAGVSVISRPMMPMDAAGTVSPWMLWHYRPVVAGVYECRFRDVERVLTLFWNGRYFQPCEGDAREVAMLTFTGWRGMWA